MTSFPDEDRQAVATQRATVTASNAGSKRVMVVESDRGLSVDTLRRFTEAGFEVGPIEDVDTNPAQRVVLVVGAEPSYSLQGWRRIRPLERGSDAVLVGHPGQGRDISMFDREDMPLPESPALTAQMMKKFLAMPGADADYSGPPRNRQERRAAKRQGRAQDA